MAVGVDVRFSSLSLTAETPPTTAPIDEVLASSLIYKSNAELTTYYDFIVMVKYD